MSVDGANFGDRLVTAGFKRELEDTCGIVRRFRLTSLKLSLAIATK